MSESFKIVSQIALVGQSGEDDDVSTTPGSDTRVHGPAAKAKTYVLMGLVSENVVFCPQSGAGRSGNDTQSEIPICDPSVFEMTFHDSGLVNVS